MFSRTILSACSGVAIPAHNGIKQGQLSIRWIKVDQCLGQTE
jgi:hypothetical protein